MQNAVGPNAVGPSVTIITITQYSRRECLRNLSMLIQAQVYKNIIEWIIVEGTRDRANSIKNSTLINELKERIPIIRLIDGHSGQSLSDLRNAGNDASRGDIIVCMDDDDYYPPTRVSHAVYVLQSQSAALIAGCSRAYIYFYTTGKFFQFKEFGKGHSTNNCFAYKRAYLENHKYMTGLAKAEESSFTNEFSEPMVQLDPAKTIVVSGHSANTVDKTHIDPRMMIKVPDLVTEYIPLPIIMKMEKMLYSTPSHISNAQFI